MIILSVLVGAVANSQCTHNVCLIVHLLLVCIGIEVHKQQFGHFMYKFSFFGQDQWLESCCHVGQLLCCLANICVTERHIHIPDFMFVFNYALVFLFPDFLVFRLQIFLAFFFVINESRRIFRRTHFANFFRASRHFVVTSSFDQSGCRLATFCWHWRRLWRRHNFRSVRDFNLSQCFTSHGGFTADSVDPFLTTISWNHWALMVKTSRFLARGIWALNSIAEGVVGSQI